MKPAWYVMLGNIILAICYQLFTTRGEKVRYSLGCDEYGLINNAELALRIREHESIMQV
jgi:hypothetical protein